MLSICWGIEFFRPYLYGRKFTVVTDHRPLLSIFSHKNPNSKLTRIRLELSDYHFDIIYKKGINSTNADALSRIEIDSTTLKNMILLGNDEKVKKTLVITRDMSKMLSEKNIIRYKNIISESHKGTDQLHMWDCTSICDIKRATKLKLKKDQKIMSKNYINI